MTVYGTPSAALGALDSTKTVASGGTWDAGDSFDCKHGTEDLLASYWTAQFSLDNAVADGSENDGLDVEVIVQYSDDNTNWPDVGLGHPIYAHADSTVGAEVALSEIRSDTPQHRYARFNYKNNNSTDDIVVSSEAATHFLEDNS